MNLTIFILSIFLGGYTFGVGLATFLCSKEFFVIEHEFWTGISLALLIVIGVKKFGPSTRAFADKLVDVS